MKNIAIFIPDRNRRGKKDYSCVFKEFALKFKQLSENDNVIIHEIQDNKKKYNKLQDIKRHLKARQYNEIFFFCHGSMFGLQCGLTIWNYKQFIDLINNDIKIVLYCCNSIYIARKLAKLLRKKGVKYEIFCHTTSGHACHNPYVKILRSDEKEKWYVDPKDKPKWAKWVKYMKEEIFCLLFHNYKEDY